MLNKSTFCESDTLKELMESDKATCKYKKLMRRWRPDWVVKARTHHSLLGNAKWTGKPTLL